MSGILYGIGVGPGDPELMTLKAVRKIRECSVIAVPGRQPEESTAFQIAVKACPEIREKELVGIHMPMTKDEDRLRESHEAGAGVLGSCLSKGKDVAFLTLGDPTVYSTYLYLHRMLKTQGFVAEIINGIPSFCAAAARMDTGLAEKNQPLHIIPAAYEVENCLKLSGTKVFMKAGKNLPKLKEKLVQENLAGRMVENCGMGDERLYESTAEIPREAGYYSLIIVKEQEDAR
ncbi:precorrin-2 C(20)-methyltransferase [Anaerostipes sp.]|uniref:precorrin-2 C(20)-methyltransferase n=1 Tax=Anaerostipes sp. TaxID=1872530 RepID=UPI0025C6936E|nr:precorrin-2 C(20)-methyltransferase [Anaerostipes sp.]MBS7007398.1 precorrin-2 C(20)-methyltransferase [Anaerostipes sp.]